MKFHQLTKHPSYGISKCGVVRKVEELKTRISSYGYKVLTITSYGKRRVIPLHRLLAEQFIPNPKNYRFVVHLDGDKLNNDLDNLKWTMYPCDTKANQERRLGKTKYRLTKDEVIEIRGLIGKGLKQTEIARKFNITQQTIFSIKHFKTWKN